MTSRMSGTAAGALPDTYWARELDVDLDEWNTYLR